MSHSDINEFTATARIAAEPKIHRTDKGAVARMFAIINDGENKTPINVVAFGKEAADYVEQKVRKGDKIGIEGELQQNACEKDGVKHTSLEVAVRPGRGKLECISDARRTFGKRKSADDDFTPPAA